MRVNVYTEELINGGTAGSLAEVVSTEYTSSRTGLPMKNYGLRIYMKSAPELHFIPGRDDDRSAVTIWCGNDKRNVFAFWNAVKVALEVNNMEQWRAKVSQAAAEAEVAESERRTDGEYQAGDDIAYNAGGASEQR